ncbi:winged helix-turn-helix domain-containing protein [Robinsoniella peoriensis]
MELTSIEFKILKLFMGAPGRVFTKKQIYEAAWEDQYIVDDNNIMVYISKIRDKIGERNGESYIRTIRGLGYKMISE